MRGGYWRDIQASKNGLNFKCTRSALEAPNLGKEKQKAHKRKPLVSWCFRMVGLTGFEPATP